MRIDFGNISREVASVASSYVYNSQKNFCVMISRCDEQKLYHSFKRTLRDKI